jgi:hypothetical protein
MTLKTVKKKLIDRIFQGKEKDFQHLAVDDFNNYLQKISNLITKIKSKYAKSATSLIFLIFVFGSINSSNDLIVYGLNISDLDFRFLTEIASLALGTNIFVFSSSLINILILSILRAYIIEENQSSDTPILDFFYIDPSDLWVDLITPKKGLYKSGKNHILFSFISIMCLLLPSILVLLASCIVLIQIYIMGVLPEFSSLLLFLQSLFSPDHLLSFSGLIIGIYGLILIPSSTLLRFEFYFDESDYSNEIDV